MDERTQTITRGNALYLASRIGMEERSGNRYVFDLLSKHLFDAYASIVERGDFKAWQRLPTALELADEAVNAMQPAADGSEAHVERAIRMKIAQKTHDVIVAAAPKLAGLVQDVSVAILHNVMTELMGRRALAALNAVRVDRMMPGSLRSFDDAKYLSHLPNGVRTEVFAKVAEEMLTSIAERGEEADLPEKMLANLEKLVIAARELGGTEDVGTWQSLSRSEALIEGLRRVSEPAVVTGMRR